MGWEEVIMERKTLIALAGLIAFALAAASTSVNGAPDSPLQSPATPLHPDFALLDASGANVLESAQSVSTMRTCGQCHDTGFIETHAFHSDLGLRDFAASKESWDASPGLFGRWNPLSYRYLSQAGDERLDLGTAEWLQINGERVVGGGPATRSRSGVLLTDLQASAEQAETSILDEQGVATTWNWRESGTMEIWISLHLWYP